MSRMTYAEKQERAEARYYGKRCAVAVDHCLFHAREAAGWARVGASRTLIDMWQQRAAENAEDAVKYARMAAHHAQLAAQASARGYYFKARLRTKIADADTDEHGQERAIPVGTAGTVTSWDTDARLYDIAWDNGGWTRWTPEEIGRDADIIEIYAYTRPEQERRS